MRDTLICLIGRLSAARKGLSVEAPDVMQQKRGTSGTGGHCFVVEQVWWPRRDLWERSGGASLNCSRSGRGVGDRLQTVSSLGGFGRLASGGGPAREVAKIVRVAENMPSTNGKKCLCIAPPPGPYALGRQLARQRRAGLPPRGLGPGDTRGAPLRRRARMYEEFLPLV